MSVRLRPIAWLLVASLALAACRALVANGVVVVYNSSHAAASMAWQSPGFLGTPILGSSGSTAINACGTFSLALPAGDHHVTIMSDTDSTSFVVHAPPAASVTLTYTIDATRRIAPASSGETLPTNGTCRP